MKCTMLVLACCTAVAGCGGDSEPATPDAAAAADAAPARPAITASVTPATATAGTTVTLHVAVTDFELVNPTTNPPPALGEGHFHIYFDDSPDYGAGWDPDVSITTTAADVGTHTVRVILVNSLHMELAPAIESTATFTLE